VPNGVDIHRFVPEEVVTPEPEILFVGSFRHRPNVMGFEKLLAEVMPRIWAAFPRLRLRVVAGPRHEQFLDAEVRDHRVEILGFVEDLRPLYARASVVVAPLAVSAGTNIKVLEAMACAKAIVTTAAGCAGLDLRDGWDALIREDWAGFADAVCELLAKDGLRSSLGTHGRSAVEERFSWDTIANRAYESYVTLAGRGPMASESSVFCDSLRFM
jgi:glycosyltransferase involved in cell wall biosynthesis